MQWKSLSVKPIKIFRSIVTSKKLKAKHKKMFFELTGRYLKVEKYISNRRVTRSFQGRGVFSELVHFNKYFIYNIRIKRPHREKVWIFSWTNGLAVKTLDS